MVAPTQPATCRPSASLILAAKEEDPSAVYDYKVLLIKRTEGTSYALNHCVFPGGVFDARGDESPEWLNYFLRFGVTKDQLEMLTRKQETPRPEFLVGRDIALRLTALRETFEEVGILICTNKENLRKWNSHSGQPRTLLLDPENRSQWQQRVHNDASQFLALCRHFDVLPNLWALHEWSALRTAATASRRFDTIYYLTFLEERSQEVQILPEPKEVASAFWLSPKGAWDSSQEGTIWLPFTLLFDIARLMNLRQWQQLFDFARQRSLRGITLMQPVYYRCDDCMFGVLQGDELYPSEPETCTQTIILPGSLEQLNRGVSQYHRYIVYDLHKVVLASNVPPVDGHLQPLLNTKLAKL